MPTRERLVEIAKGSGLVAVGIGALAAGASALGGETIALDFEALNNRATQVIGGLASIAVGSGVTMEGAGNILDRDLSIGAWMDAAEAAATDEAEVTV